MKKFPVLILVIFSSVTLAQPVNRLDVIIDEVLADPEPAVGLPEGEFIELRNVSQLKIDLKGWKITNGRSVALVKEHFLLHPDSLVVLCAMSQFDSYSNFGNTIGLQGFPALDNDKGVVLLLSPDDRVIHSLQYEDSWYKNDVKSQGGWTLEMIDVRNPCAGSDNWNAAMASQGGTPGKNNSADGANPDELSPRLIRASVPDSITVQLFFNEPLDSLKTALTTNFTIDAGIVHPASVEVTGPFFDEVILHLPQKLQVGKIYQVSCTNVADCSGNSIRSDNMVKVALPDDVSPLDVVINEILFNPVAGGYDYLELYNRSNKAIDLKQLFAASRNAVGALTNTTRLKEMPFLIFPGEYFAFTEDIASVKDHFRVKEGSVIFQVASLPPLPDDRGVVVLADASGNIIDELKYDKAWHFDLINDPSGVALERINYNDATQLPGNWTSASSTSGFGTPGYQNSQFRADLQAKGEISIEPSSFSPDNDGYNDFCSILYAMQEPGYVANIRVYDVSGRALRHLAKNAILGISGTFHWDGLDEYASRLPQGVYIILTEIFNLAGKTRKFKHAVSLVR